MIMIRTLSLFILICLILSPSLYLVASVGCNFEGPGPTTEPAGGITSEEEAEELAGDIRNAVSSLTIEAVISGLGFDDGEPVGLTTEEKSSVTCEPGVTHTIACPGGGSALINIFVCTETEGPSFTMEGKATFIDCIVPNDDCPLEFDGSLDFSLSLDASLPCVTPSSSSCIIDTAITLTGDSLTITDCDGSTVEVQEITTTFQGTCDPAGLCEGCFSSSVMTLKEGGCFQCLELGPVCTTEGENHFVCDQDSDCDQAPNATDNCPEDFNPSQTDLDGNRVGEVCEPFAPVSRCSELTECEDENDCNAGESCTEGCCSFRGGTSETCPNDQPVPECGDGLPPCRGVGEICDPTGCCVPPPPPGCLSDPDCAPGEACIDGTCVPSEPPPPPP